MDTAPWRVRSWAAVFSPGATPAAPRRPACEGWGIRRRSQFAGGSRPLQGRHKLGPDRVQDGLVQDPIDYLPACGIERPACDAKRRAQLIGPTPAPERHADALIEHPADGQVNHAPQEVILREPIEPPHGLEVLPKAGLLELRVDPTQVIAFKGRLRAHPAAQEATTQRPVA